MEMLLLWNLFFFGLNLYYYINSKGKMSVAHGIVAIVGFLAVVLTTVLWLQ
jgi:hypothetical protein